MEYRKVCLFCRKVFIAKRKDKVYHDSECKVKHWNLTNGFKKIEDFLPEAEVKRKYYKPQPDDKSIYMQWFRYNGERFADVYESITVSPSQAMKRFKDKVPIRLV